MYVFTSPAPRKLASIFAARLCHHWRDSFVKDKQNTIVSFLWYYSEILYVSTIIIQSVPKRFWHVSDKENFEWLYNNIIISLTVYLYQSIHHGTSRFKSIRSGGRCSETIAFLGLGTTASSTLAISSTLIAPDRVYRFQRCFYHSLRMAKRFQGLVSCGPKIVV